jgi:beta-lactamase regulating signal transducer with metallopeptidase domain/uncharacterized protein (DUF2141 family)
MTTVQDLAAQAWVQHVGWALVQFLWQGTVISVLFGAVHRSLRRHVTAHLRYIVACATLGLLVITPGVTFVVHASLPAAPAWSVPSPEIWRSILPWLVAVWMCGVMVFSARLIVGWRVTSRLRSIGVCPAPLEWQRRLEVLIRRVGLSRPVRLLVSSLVDIPVVIGCWRPVILVPLAALSALPPVHLEALLTHELAHVRRLDYVVNLLQGLAEAFLFFHPAVWWVSAQIRAERELCCDDVAVAVTGDALTYARALAELESRRPAHATSLAATGGSLVDRIRRLLGQAPSAWHALPDPGTAATMSVLWLLGIGAVSVHAAAPHVVPAPLLVRSSFASEALAPTHRPVVSTILFGPVGPAPVRSAVLQQPRSAPVQTAATATAALSGVIVAADTGTPIKRAHVVITAEALRSARTVITDDDGRYAFTELPAGRYTITASKAGYFDAIFGQKVPPHAGTPVLLADGQTRDHLDIRLPKGGVISGLLRDENGDPSPDTPVRAMRYDLRTGERQLVTQATNHTDDRGVYRLYNLPPGTYLIVAVPSLDTDTPPTSGGRAGGGGRGRPPDPEPASMPGQAPRTDYVPVYYPGTTSAATAGSVVVGLGEEKFGVDFQLQLVPTAKLQGTVVGIELASSSFSISVGGRGEITQQPGARLRSIELVNTDAQPGQPRASGTNMIAGNRFTFGSVAPGRYVIEVRGSKSAVVGGPLLGIWGDLPVVVDGRNQDDLVITMQDGVAMTGHLTLDPAVRGGTPDVGATRVSLTPQGSGGQLAGRTVADAAGRFTILGVVPGAYTVDVVGPAGWMAKSVMVGGKDALDFGLYVQGGEPIDDVTVVLTNQSTLVTGTLRDAAGHATADDTVIVFAADPQYWVPGSRRIQATRPSSDGKFSVRGLPAGDYLMAVVSDIEGGQWYDPSLLAQLKSAATPIHLADGDQKTQDLRMAGGGL